ncbi:MAG: hypothetical protein BGO21_24355 [Dyadobacter sp. 50-39]|uniref:hypothetical protein n=1 Tax=Dyadobacter sp. 50-39 TaxID=1895756 RepID=UPI0009641EA3|nr:hypothetical protein [Dyadobacter sp. 50-39]OJV18659.1 MAG: hypothetical protein BGO21_24355 [Dyadobacter sp. 50-39]
MAALSWKSNFTETECRIFRGKVIAGILKTTIFKYDGRGELDGYMLTFKSKGFFQSRTEIRDIEGRSVLGDIEYNLFRSKAWITYEGKRYEWRLESWLRSKWVVANGESEARFESAGFWKREGNVINEDIPPPVILASFFVQSFFHKISSAS